MALDSFKNIIDNKGYRISSKDREIFERGNLQSFFGFSNSDMIEFIVYDVNDNQLPLSGGNDVRYIPLTTENIRDYFIIANGTLFQQYQFPTEYFIDIERILREEGYNNGIFKVQATLLNARVGTPDRNNRLWIQEISPSRTEVRLLPLKNDVTQQSEIYERYNIFVNGGNFREDTLQAVPAFISNITPNNIYSILIDKYGNEFLDKIQQEFSIKDFDILFTNIYSKFIESSEHEFANRISDIFDVNYGKPKNNPPQLELSVNQIKNICLILLARAIDYYLPTRNLTYTSNEDIVQEDSIDNYPGIATEITSNTQITTTVPAITFVSVNKNKQTASKAPALTNAIQRSVMGASLPGGSTGPVISPAPVSATPATASPGNNISGL